MKTGVFYDIQTVLSLFFFPGVFPDFPCFPPVTLGFGATGGRTATASTPPPHSAGPVSNMGGGGGIKSGMAEVSPPIPTVVPMARLCWPGLSVAYMLRWWGGG